MRKIYWLVTIVILTALTTSHVNSAYILNANIHPCYLDINKTQSADDLTSDTLLSNKFIQTKVSHVDVEVNQPISSFYSTVLILKQAQAPPFVR